jgi:hypothetical protein
MPNRNTRATRLERRSRPLPLAPLIALALLAVGIAYAQQNLPAPAVPSAPPATTAPATGSDTSAPAAAPADAESTPAGDANEDDAATPPPPSAAAGKGSPQRFEPTEKVRPDFDVAFPIDI